MCKRYLQLQTTFFLLQAQQEAADGKIREAKKSFFSARLWYAGGLVAGVIIFSVFLIIIIAGSSV